MRAAVAIFLVLLVAGCPRPRRHTLVPSVPTSGDAQARDRFLEARERFLDLIRAHESAADTISAPALARGGLVRGCDGQ